VLAKGAPEVLLDPDAHPDLIAAAEELAAKALRTLAMAHGPAPDGDPDDDALFAELTPLGVLGLQDPHGKPPAPRSPPCTPQGSGWS
jgi:P-type Ca2+ transporter type 2C